jgi:hypothetical protein
MGWPEFKPDPYIYNAIVLPIELSSW